MCQHHHDKCTHREAYICALIKNWTAHECLYTQFRWLLLLWKMCAQHSINWTRASVLQCCPLESPWHSFWCKIIRIPFNAFTYMEQKDGKKEKEYVPTHGLLFTWKNIWSHLWLLFGQIQPNMGVNLSRVQASWHSSLYNNHNST